MSSFILPDDAKMQAAGTRFAVGGLRAARGSRWLYICIYVDVDEQLAGCFILSGWHAS